MMTEKGDRALNTPGGRKRTKKDYIVLSFASYENAMEMEAFCHAGQIPGRLIPLPPQVSAGCGLCWRMEPQEWEAAEDAIRTQGPIFSGPHPVRLWTMQGK